LYYYALLMLERTEQRFGLKPKLLAADTAYGSAPMLNWLVGVPGLDSPVSLDRYRD
jgi:hypothetical protein